MSFYLLVEASFHKCLVRSLWYITRAISVLRPSRDNFSIMARESHTTRSYLPNLELVLLHHNMAAAQFIRLFFPLLLLAPLIGAYLHFRELFSRESRVLAPDKHFIGCLPASGTSLLSVTSSPSLFVSVLPADGPSPR